MVVGSKRTLRTAALGAGLMVFASSCAVGFSAEPVSGGEQSSDQSTLEPSQVAKVAARRKESTNNLKTIGLGILNYEYTNKRLPARAKFNVDGKPLLSWRVLVLPYLNEGELFKQFHLDEPWDSDHNKRLLEKMPAAYKDPQVKYEPGKTVYQAVIGRGLAFEGNEALRLASVIDGTSKTIVVVETAQERAVPWTKPEDWEVDLKDPLKGLADVPPDGTFQALFFDGHADTIKRTIDPEVLKVMLTRNGGEPFQFDAIPRP